MVNGNTLQETRKVGHFTLKRRTLVQSLLAAGTVSVLAKRLYAEEEADERLLDEIERRGCLYFSEMADPQTGLVRDRAEIGSHYSPGVASIAATGFGLSSLCIADRRGYLDRQAVKGRVRTTLAHLNQKAEHAHGFFYHFLDSATGKRVWESEASSVDTTWLLCGVLHCRAHFDDPEIRRLAGALLDRVEWRWMLDGDLTLCHGWKPERGFLSYRWDSYAEVLAMYLLAIGGSTGNAIPAKCWDSWKRPMRDFEGVFYIDAGTPLFVHQYSHAWFDFRNREDHYANYFNNSARATQAHRLYCIHLADKFPWYGPDMWGVTASDSRAGYRVWASADAPPDGSLVPCASGGSIVFLPQLCLTVLKNMMERYGWQAWTKYGFVDAFQPDADWYSQWAIGINVGIMTLMAENMRSEGVWQAVMSTPEAQCGMDRVGLARKA